MAATVKKSEVSVLCHLNFPSYQIRALNDEVVIVSGGGGSAKTGVLNQIELFKIPIPPRLDKQSKPQPPSGTISLGSLDTGENAIMSLDLVSMGGAALLCTAEGNRCVEYFIDCNNTSTTAQSTLQPNTLTQSEAPGATHSANNSIRQRNHVSSISSEKSLDGTETVTAHRAQPQRRSRKRSESFTCAMEPDLFSCTRLYVGGVATTGLRCSANFSLNCVRYTPDASSLLLGSPKEDSDSLTGRLRVLSRTGCIPAASMAGTTEYAGFCPLLDIDASVPTRGSPTDVQSLCVSPDGSLVCTICDAPDNRVARVWNLHGNQRHHSQGPLFATLSYQSQVDYRVRHCTFGRIPGRSLREGFLLYLTHMPVSVRVAAPNFISVWFIAPLSVADNHTASSNGPPTSTAFAEPKRIVLHTLPTNQRPACISISDDGRHVALGSLEGRVEVFESRQDGLKTIYVNPESHSTFVTDLCFLPLHRSQRSGLDWEMLSISTDTRLRWHAVQRTPQRRLNVIFIVAHLVLLLFMVALLSLFES